MSRVSSLTLCPPLSQISSPGLLVERPLPLSLLLLELCSIALSHIHKPESQDCHHSLVWYYYLWSVGNWAVVSCPSIIKSLWHVTRLAPVYSRPGDHSFWLTLSNTLPKVMPENLFFISRPRVARAGTNKLKCQKNPHWVRTWPKTSAERHFLGQL